MATQRITKNQLSNLPPEVKKYYSTENRDRASLAWLVGVASLLVTVGLVLGVFFGGRWAYRQLKGTDVPQVVTTETQSTDEPISSNSELQETESSTTTEPSTAPVTETSSTSTTQVSTTPAPSTVAAASTSTDSIVKTGLSGTVKVFALVSLAAGTAHAAVSKRRLIKE